MAIFTSIIKQIQFNFNDKLNNINFIQQTASLSIKIDRTNHGDLVKYSLSFKINLISVENDTLVNKIKNTRRFVVTDFHNYVTMVGSDAFPPKISISKDTTGTAGGFRGYIVNVEWSYIS